MGKPRRRPDQRLSNLIEEGGRSQKYATAYDDDMYIESSTTMDVYVPEDDDRVAVILVSDGNGTYREHRVVEPRRRLGFI